MHKISAAFSLLIVSNINRELRRDLSFILLKGASTIPDYLWSTYFDLSQSFGIIVDFKNIILYSLQLTEFGIH